MMLYSQPYTVAIPPRALAACGRYKFACITVLSPRRRAVPPPVAARHTSHTGLPWSPPLGNPQGSARLSAPEAR